MFSSFKIPDSSSRYTYAFDTVFWQIQLCSSPCGLGSLEAWQRRLEFTPEDHRFMHTKRLMICLTTRGSEFLTHSAGFNYSDDLDRSLAWCEADLLGMVRGARGLPLFTYKTLSTEHVDWSTMINVLDMMGIEVTNK